ncbi:MAG: M15 family metallopeptidase [Deltaproteobacteria bacterium]|nr:M15 family metallopeptidase [Deltaproteobacteria bacterium]
MTPDLDAPAESSSVEASPPRQERLPWVNPARCALPCTYDPQARLVSVDNNGVLDPAGGHLVDQSIQEPLGALVRAAHTAGHKLRIESAFRSYDDQVRLYRQIKQVGRAARPGHSEHQLGTAIDFRLPTSASIAWLAQNAPDHGFVLSYPDGKQRITGYRPEPWHVRHVGPQLANELRTSGLTLEELFRARPALGESGSCEDCPQPASRRACGTIKAAGTCDGTVLHWCYDDALASVDCAAFNQRCGRTRSSDVFDCIDAR